MVNEQIPLQRCYHEPYGGGVYNYRSGKFHCGKLMIIESARKPLLMESTTNQPVQLPLLAQFISLVTNYTTEGQTISHLDLKLHTNLDLKQVMN